MIYEKAGVRTYGGFGVKDKRLLPNGVTCNSKVAILQLREAAVLRDWGAEASSVVFAKRIRIRPFQRPAANRVAGSRSADIDPNAGRKHCHAIHEKETHS